MSTHTLFTRRRSGVSRRLLPLLLALPFGFPALATAAPPKGDGTASAVRYRRDARKVTTRAVSSPAPARKKQPKVEGPGMSGDPWGRQQVATSLAVTDDLISTAKRLMEAVTDGDADYPDYAFRLANLYLDKHQIFDLQAGKQFEVIHTLQEAGKKGEADQARAKQKRLQKLAREASVEAVRAFHLIVGSPKHSGYARMDEVLYFYAGELGALGRDADMQAAYLRLLQEFPTSAFVPQVYLAFADHKFTGGHIGDALQLYGKIVTGHPNSPVYAYALYRMGWCYLNPVGAGGQPDYARSLQSFSDAIQATKDGRAGNEANGKQLRREARRDLVKAYVHAGRPSRAWEFFGAVGEGPKPDENMRRGMMELLANAYYGEGKYVESTATYKTLQSEQPGDAQTCRWQAAIVDNALATDDKKIQWNETLRLAGYWESFRASKQPKKAKTQCRNDAHDALVMRATTWHDEGDKTKRDDAFELAGQAYAEFLRVFPKHKDAYEMRYYLGEVQWTQAERLYEAKDRGSQDAGRARFCEAADTFVATLQTQPRGKFTKDAALAQMLGWKNCIEYDETAGKRGSCVPQSDGSCVYPTQSRRRVAQDEKTEIDAAARFPVTPYSEKEEHMLAAYERYQKYVDDKKDPELPNILYHRARLMVEHHRFDEAMPLLEVIVKKFDGSRHSAWAAEMLIDVLTIRWADSANTPKQTIAAAQAARAWATQIEKMKLWKHTEASRLREGVPSLVMSIRWKEAEAYCESGRQGAVEGFISCGNEYYAIYEDYPTHDRGDELLYNAAIGFEAGYLVGNAIKLRNALLERHKDSKLYKKTLREVAENYQAIAYYGDAADKLEQYADAYRGDDYAATALGNAYHFRSGLGEQEAARGDIEKYEDLYRRKNPGKAAEIYWAQHALLGDTQQQLEHAEQYIDRYGKKGGKDRLAVAHAAAGQLLWRSSCGKSMLADACIAIKRKKAMAGQGARDQADGFRQEVSGKIPARCGSSTHGIIVVHDRNAKLAARAQAHFEKALALTGGSVSIPAEETDRVDAYNNAWAMALVYQADAKYEEYLKVDMPEGLDFFVEPFKHESGVPKWEREYAAQVARRDESQARFAEFLANKRALGNAILDNYGKVTKIRSPFWILAAASRSAVVWQNFADQLYRAEVPKGIRTQDQYDAYCFQLFDYAEPLEKTAVAAFEYCLERSTEHQYFNDFSRMCEEELQQRQPDRYPATNELFGKSTYTDARMDVVGVQLDLHGDRRLADSAKR